MMRICFNEETWQFELIDEEGKLLAAVYDEDEAKMLEKFYKTQNETEDTEIYLDICSDWRNQDELGGE